MTCWAWGLSMDAINVNVRLHNHGTTELHVQDITSFTNEAYEGEQLSSQPGAASLKKLRHQLECQ